VTNGQHLVVNVRMERRCFLLRAAGGADGLMLHARESRDPCRCLRSWQLTEGPTYLTHPLASYDSWVA